VVVEQPGQGALDQGTEGVAQGARGVEEVPPVGVAAAGNKLVGRLVECPPQLRDGGLGQPCGARAVAGEQPQRFPDRGLFHRAERHRLRADEAAQQH
jgi:hypothetical protein